MNDEKKRNVYIGLHWLYMERLSEAINSAESLHEVSWVLQQLRVGVLQQLKG